MVRSGYFKLNTFKKRFWRKPERKKNRRVKNTYTPLFSIIYESCIDDTQFGTFRTIRAATVVILVLSRLLPSIMPKAICFSDTLSRPNEKNKGQSSNDVSDKNKKIIFCLWKNVFFFEQTNALFFGFCFPARSGENVAFIWL